MEGKKVALWVYFFWPLVFLGICWGIWIADVTGYLTNKPGIQPREIKGLLGIISSPFLHQDFNHLINNTIPFLLLSSALFFFYKDLTYKLFFWLFLGSGVWLWCIGRTGNHIGASSLIYGMFSFVLTGGFISKNKNLLAIALLTIFVYGSMIWGIFPIDASVSWEGHLSGLLWGIILAIYFQKKIPPTPLHPLSDDNEINEANYGKDYWKTEEQILKDQLQPNIIICSEKKLIGIHLKMTLAFNRTFELWSHFMPLKHEIKNLVHQDLISLQVYDEILNLGNPNQEFTKWAAMEVSNFDEIPKGMDTIVLPPSLYAVFNYIGHPSDYRIFNYIFTVWLPNSNFELDERPYIGVMGEKYKNNDHNSEEELWIPIKAKS